MMIFDIDAAKQMVLAMDQLIQQQKDYLTELDSTIGDGDLGLTMSLGFAKSAEFAQHSQETDIGRFFVQIGMTFAQAVPSSMGTLMASAFMKAGKAVVGKCVLEAADFGDFCHGFAEGVMERGKCQPGSRTLVDAVYPAAVTAQRLANSEQNGLAEIAQQAYQAALDGVEKTKQMVPTIGKALYHKDKAIGLPDQGAVVGSIVYQGICRVLNEA